MRPVLAALCLLAACESSSEPPADLADTADTADTAVAHETAGPPDTASGGDAVSGPLAACDGPARIHVEREAGEEREVVPWLGGDTTIRGYASACGDDADPERFRIHAECGGPLTATLTWTNKNANLRLALRADEVDGGTFAHTPDGTARVITVPLGELDDADGSGDYALDLDVTCAAGAPTTWSLALDTPSERPVQRAPNGWPVDLLPEGWTACEDWRFQDLPPLIDQHGNPDVTIGQFYGDMTLVVVSAIWCTPACTTFAQAAPAMHDRVEALSDAWGFSIVEVLIEDADKQPTVGSDAVVWADAYGLSEPVLVGPEARLSADCLKNFAVPTFYILDPLLRVTDFDSGITTTDPATATGSLEKRIAEEAAQFLADHPEWVSPRCAGVAGADSLCPCAEPTPGMADADGDHVSDSCDVCALGDDRDDFDRDGVPNACDDSPGVPPVPDSR